MGYGRNAGRPLLIGVGAVVIALAAGLDWAAWRDGAPVAHRWDASHGGGSTISRETPPGVTGPRAASPAPAAGAGALAQTDVAGRPGGTPSAGGAATPGAALRSVIITAPHRAPGPAAALASGSTVRPRAIHVTFPREWHAQRFEIGPADPVPLVRLLCDNCPGNLVQISF